MGKGGHRRGEGGFGRGKKKEGISGKEKWLMENGKSNVFRKRKKERVCVRVLVVVVVSSGG